MKNAKKEINKKCPYCGGEHMTVDADICVTATIAADGSLEVKDGWDKAALNDTVNESPEKYLQGFCEDCGKYSDFFFLRGFVAKTKDK